MTLLSLELGFSIRGGCSGSGLPFPLDGSPGALGGACGRCPLRARSTHQSRYNLADPELQPLSPSPMIRISA